MTDSVRRIAGVMTLAVLVLIGLPLPLPAADNARFTFAGTVTFVEDIPKYNVFAWEGRANRLGSCTGVGQVFEGGYVRQAYVTLENEQGDSIDFYIEWVRDRQTSESIGVYEITGGTGRFADASGSGAFHALPNPGGGAAVTLDGSIAY